LIANRPISKESHMKLSESIRNERVSRDLEATHAVVHAAHGYAESAIERAAWERRGVLGRLVRVADVLATEIPASTAARRQAA
jgi:hypothetical protein